jgi:cell division septation protein DedD
MLFSVPLGNTTAGNEYIKSKVKTEQVQDQIRALSWKIRNDVESDMLALISARLQIKLSDSSSRLAEQRLEEYRKNNQLGSATIQDVLNAENDRNSAHNAQMEAVETFSNAVTKLWKDAGLLIDRYGIHIDTSHPDNLTRNKEQNPALLVDPPASVILSTSKEAAQKQATGVTPVVHEPVPAIAHRYTLSIGEYGVKSAMTDAVNKIKRAGLAPLVKRGPTKTVEVIRLYVADYPDKKSAQSEVDGLRKLKVKGFILAGKEGKFTVYAGSSRSQKLSVLEQERLATLGVKTVVKNAYIHQAVYLLTTGSFATREAAEEFATKLKNQGLKSTITENTDK